MKPLASFATALLVACLLPVIASAQVVTYVGDIPLPNNHEFILPLNGVNSGHSGTFLMTTTTLYTWNPSTNQLVVWVPQFTTGLKITSESPLTFRNLPGDPGSIVAALGVRSTLYSYNTLSTSIVGQNAIAIAHDGSNMLMLSYRDANTMALTMSGLGDRFFTFDPSIGGTPITLGLGQVSNVGGSAFGPDGLLYVLDHPDDSPWRVQGFDLNTDTVVSAFNIAASLGSGYAGMAISSNGHLYIADGSGGGTAYDLAGNHLGNFTFTGGGNPDTNGLNGVTGGAFLNIDDAGNIFVYTPETGMHHYFDASVVPEPSVTALLMGGSALALALARKGRRKG